MHRLVRDHFALHQLLPSVFTPDHPGRLQSIMNLGYQGESALDWLRELAGDPDPAVRAAALTGISHIASPLATQCIEEHASDTAHGVRQAVISAVFAMPEPDMERILDRIQPLGDGS